MYTFVIVRRKKKIKWKLSFQTKLLYSYEFSKITMENAYLLIQ